MIDFDEELMKMETPDDIKTMKHWMFKEQVRIQAKQEELEALNRDLHSLKRALERERIALDVKAKTLKKRYDDNEIFIAKKKKIIEDAYQQLTLDRKALD